MIIFQTFFEETSMDSQQFQESLFYLRTYGTYLSIVEFHRRHGYYMKAVQYILDHVSYSYYDYMEAYEIYDYMDRLIKYIIN